MLFVNVCPVLYTVDCEVLYLCPFPIFHTFILLFIYSFIHFFIHSFINKYVLTIGTGLNLKYSISALSTFTHAHSYWRFSWREPDFVFIDNKYFLRAYFCIFIGKYECLYWSHTCYSTFCHSWFCVICHYFVFALLLKIFMARARLRIHR